MIYPIDFEAKIGFTRIKSQIAALCSTDGAKQRVEELNFATDHGAVRSAIVATDQMKTILMLDNDFPSQGYVDTAHLLKKAEIIGSFLDPSELVQLKSALILVHDLILYFRDKEEDSCSELKKILHGVVDFPAVIYAIDAIVDRFGKIKDNASPELQRIRREISDRESQISKRLQHIMRQAQEAGFVDEDVTISIRDGRAVIPVSAAHKKKIKGFIHDESATGKTFYVEPIEIVEINNELKELEYDERREIVRILTVFTDELRPQVAEISVSCQMLIIIDFIRAKARHAITNECGRPILADQPQIELRNARHLLLEQTLKREGRKVVPLDLRLNNQKHMLVISGPNAGGKSVCLKTVALIQYMLQCGLLIPASENSEIGLFNSIFMDIGDEQSIDNDLSTYSSHLLNMKVMLKSADNRSLVFIDEFGTGTEPAMGGAIAESVLAEFERKGVFGIITTHYSNLKYYASSAEGIINGAMSFDVQNIRPLFKLEIGKPGSSFAIEIARKIGLPENIIESAKQKIGSEQVNIEKQLREIARDKRYWEGKRDRIRLAEKRTEEIAEKYGRDLETIKEQKTKIIKEAKEQANKIITEANRQIENTIREIREAQAEREKTREARKRFEEFKSSVTEQPDEQDDFLERKIAKIKEREQRRLETRSNPTASEPKTTVAPQPAVKKTLEVGDKVRIKGQESMGEVVSIAGKRVVVAIGQILTTIASDRVDPVSNADYKRVMREKANNRPSVIPTYDVSEKRLNFKPQIDVRGMRAAEALERVREFVDEAIMLGISDLRILHGKGTGALMQEIRSYLNAVDVVESARDEHIEFGGSGITVVKLDL